MTDERYAWLRAELKKPTVLERHIARCEKARDEAHDPDMKIIWEGKARELRGKHNRELDRLRRQHETF
tara:strand:- start:1006 stop:1209 length:204 start_codon:yes stop_codon:yes gene_type:complete